MRELRSAPYCAMLKGKSPDRATAPKTRSTTSRFRKCQDYLQKKAVQGVAYTASQKWSHHGTNTREIPKKSPKMLIRSILVVIGGGGAFAFCPHLVPRTGGGCQRQSPTLIIKSKIGISATRDTPCDRHPRTRRDYMLIPHACHRRRDVLTCMVHVALRMYGLVLMFFLMQTRRAQQMNPQNSE